MKHLLLTTIAAVLLVGCGESQSITKAPDISIQNAATIGHIAAVKQHLAAGTEFNAKYHGNTILYVATINIDKISCDGLAFPCSEYLSLTWNHRH